MPQVMPFALACCMLGILWPCPVLDVPGAYGHGYSMKIVWRGLCGSCLWAVVCAFPCKGQQPVPVGPGPEEEAVVHEDPVPADVPASAVAAVTRLGEEVVLGRYQVAIERMNPQWLERAAKSLGSKEELERKIEGVAAEMVRQGISMISSKPQGQPLVYQVAPGHRAGGFGYTKWLVLVPTATRFRVMSRVEGGPPQTVTIEKTGYQAAIADKGMDNWTFIDGAGLKVSDLRGLFPTLPLDMKLPPVEEKVIR